MGQQWILFKTAIMFFTRINVGNLPYSKENLQGSARYFSWVGIIVGLTGGLVLWASSFVFSPALSVLFSMLTTILLTGAFHEDGFADCCDAFGGGWTVEKILTIMKDSRLGTYGVIGLIGILTAKYLLLLELTENFPAGIILFGIIAAHANSRFWATTLMQKLIYVQDIDASKSKPLADRKLTSKETAVLALGSFAPLALFFTILYTPVSELNHFHLDITFISWFLSFLFWVQVPPFIVQLFAVRYFKKWIGGYTGDCLGATQQVCEIAFYLGCLCLWKFI
ncbi:adenosylcobinamide-GDP ribazoletransferase [Sediminibacterium sp.]|uniref:adenosylcobinamide-GDP ribazoletransferase n=1 Tax=Sediminibacterium sp. TaxID=1917865 RepID=UPI003F6A2BFB